MERIQSDHLHFLNLQNLTSTMVENNDLITNFEQFFYIAILLSEFNSLKKTNLPWLPSI